MARKKRGRKKKFKPRFNVRAETVRSTISILFILISCMILISFVASDEMLNAKIQALLRIGFGYASFLLIPILLISALILTNTFKWKILELRIVAGLSVLLFTLAGFLHLFTDRVDAYEIARDGGGGGIVGYKLTSALMGVMNAWQAGLVLMAFTLIGVIWTLDKGAGELKELAKAAIEKLGYSFDRTDAQKDSSDEDSKSNIEVSSSINQEADDYDMHHEPAPAMVSVPEPEITKIEIIPSMTEPLSSLDASNAGDSVTSIGSLVPHLPYIDTVWELPPLELLNDPSNLKADRGDVVGRKKLIVETLESFGIKTTIDTVRYGPTVTQYVLKSESGTKIAKIVNLQYDLALQLASPTGSVRIEAPIPGESAIGIEVPNTNRVPVSFKELLISENMKKSKSRISIVLGKDVKGETHVYNISKMPHLLIAGSTGSGKSVFIHNIMASILFRATPQEVKFILIDPKRVELVHYNDIPHLLSPVITDIDKAPSAFKWLVQEMDRRYKLLEGAKVRNIEAYNEKSGFQAMSYIVLIVDELAEIMITDPAAVEKSIVRLAQLARATGIHLILALQRPSTNVVTGLIKANIPCRIAFGVTSQVDSRVIIDQPGAEKLLGMGDMLFVPPDDSKPTRIQGALVTDKEINNLVSYLKSRGVKPDYKNDITEIKEPEVGKSVAAGGESVDELFDEAVELVVAEGKGSASLLQRKLSIGYSRAARILDELEAHGIVGPANGSKPREILNTSSSSSFDHTDEEY